ncbi:glycosyltransferase [Candidatus Entotheonella palauensis]|uniref:glycosyltransferase n=1 Tax=Candidatus Entotheonella palauensis TaxID=93172 RepID=UPI000B7D94EB|nr:glycosyltransferase [Candidatus Entotheonella palauensis]
MQVVKPNSEYRSHLSSPPQSSHISIVRIIDRLNIGGPAKHVVWLTTGLTPDAFDTVLITGTVPPGEGDMSYFARSEGVEPLVLPAMSRELSLRDGLVVWQLLRLLWRLRPDIVHTHKAKAGAVGRLAAWLYKWLTPSALWLRPRPCTIVHTYHGHVLHSYFGPFKTRVFLMIERLFAKLTDCIIAVSEQQRQELSIGFRVGKPAQYRMIPLGLDVDAGQSTPCGLRQALGLAPETVLIGIVGRLCEVKNHAMMLEATAQLVEKADVHGGAVHLVVIGDGHLAGELSTYAHHLNISDHVTFTGFREDVLSLYADLDIVALTSLNEGTPLTLIEAMCHGRAVAATEVGGVVDILGELRMTMNGFSMRDYGVTAPSRDATAFARSLQYLIERPILRHQMGTRGRVFVRTAFSKARLLHDIETLYRGGPSSTQHVDRIHSKTMETE